MLDIRVEGADEFAEAIELVKQTFPKDVAKFMRAEGTKLKNVTKKKARTMVKQHSGNFVAGIKRGKYYIYHEGSVPSIRVYAGDPAYHAHLLEYGHDIVKGVKGSKGFKIRGTGRVVGHARAFHVFQTAANEFQDRFVEDSERFASKVADKLD